VRLQMNAVDRKQQQAIECTVVVAAVVAASSVGAVVDCGVEHRRLIGTMAAEGMHAALKDPLLLLALEWSWMNLGVPSLEKTTVSAHILEVGHWHMLHQPSENQTMLRKRY